MYKSQIHMRIFRINFILYIASLFERLLNFYPIQRNPIKKWEEKRTLSNSNSASLTTYSKISISLPLFLLLNLYISYVFKILLTG